MSSALASAYVRLVPSTENFARDTEGQLGGGLTSLGRKLGQNLGKAIAAGGAIVAAVGLTKGLTSSVSAFKDLSQEVIQFQRVTGGSVKDASRLRFAIHESGVDVTKATSAFTIFDKKLGAAAGNQKKTAALTALLGQNFTNAAGQILPMSKILPGLADRFAGMPDGIAKTTLATQLFGRSGTQLLPFLNKGSEGIAELSKESDKLGLTLGGKQIESFKKYKAAGRELDATFDGLKVQIGAKLLPILTQFTQFITGQVTPGISALIGYIKQSPAFAQFGTVLGQVFSKAGVVIQTFTAAAIPVLKTIASSITGTLIPAVESVVTYLVGKLAPVFTQVFGIITTQVLPILASFATFLYGKLLPAIAEIYLKIFQNLKPAFEALVSTYQTQVLPALQSVLAKFREYQPTIQTVYLAIVKVIGKVVEFASMLLGKLLPVLIKIEVFIDKIWVKTIVAAFELLYNAVKKSIQFMVASVGTLLTVFSKLLGVLGHLPAKLGGNQFKAAASAAHNAAGYVKSFGDALNRIPRVVSVLISVREVVNSAGAAVSGGALGSLGNKLGSGAVKGTGNTPEIKLPTLGGGGSGGGSGGGGGGKGKSAANTAKAAALKAAKAARAEAKKLLTELTAGVKDGGAKLQSALDDIKSHIADLPKGIRAPLRALVTTFSAQLTSLTTQLGAAKDKLASIQSAYADLASSIASAFNPSDLFSAGLAELKTGLDASLANVTAALQAQATLLAAGVSGAFLNSLLSSGNGTLALALADNTDLARQYGAEFDQIQSQAASLGDIQAQAQFNPQIAATNLLISQLNAKIDKLAGQIGTKIGAILAGAISKALSKVPGR